MIGEEINVEECKNKIQVWKEKTTTSPPGKHSQHDKALLGRGPDNPKLEEGIDLNTKQDILLNAVSRPHCPALTSRPHLLTYT
eukprot:13411797-Ditylum_brightwellii.AAC.1